MPRVSQFYGISIYFYFGDHNPPHFHARYQGRDAVFSIGTLQLIEGQARPRVRRMVEEWARLHRRELLSAWAAIQEGREPAPIPPLE